jgi:Cd2+/Zn2+-exporting ATPase
LEGAMEKYKINVNNLDCANCARKLEEELNKNDKFKNVVVNFGTSKLTYESNEKISIKEMNKIVNKIDTDVNVSEEDVAKPKEFHLSVLIIAIILGIVGLYIKLPHIIKQVLIIISYILLLYKTFINACKMLVKNKTVNENALITISCVGAYLIGEPAEGLMVIVLYTIGKILEEKAINNSRKSINELINIKQDYANKKENGNIEKIDVEDIKINDILVVKKGERIPVDGIVTNGTTEIDSSMLTGESDLVKIKENDIVLSGSINTEDIIEIKATNVFKDSTVSKILELVEDATDKKTKTETFVAKASRIYTPVIFILGVIIAVFLPLLFNISYMQSIYRGLTFLVISCPCAIAISIPLSYFTGIGTASKNGILIKGSNYLDSLSHINKIIFDKTGTLTDGSFRVTDIQIFDNNYTKDKVIDILSKGESLSNHPIAKSILKLKDEQIDNSNVENFEEIEGKGISYTLDGNKIKIGNKSICNCEEEAILHLSINDKHIASITIDDGIKENAYNTMLELKNNNIKTYMFTGDKKEIALNIGKKLKIDEIKYEMLPTDKYKNYENIIENGDIIAYVGDGINDSPVLKRADIGISMGGVGQEAAIEASDIVLMSDDLIKIPLAINISKYTNYIIKQNLIFAISVKTIILLLSVVGIANMWFAVFADTGVTLITILNTLRIMHKFQNK